MNKKEIQTVKQEAQRFSKDIRLTQPMPEVIRLVLPFKNALNDNIHFFVVKRKGDKKFSLLQPVESTGLVAVNNTLARLQPLLQTYGLMLSPEAVIMEESTLPLHKRISNMAQALIAIDGIRRLWKIEYDRRPHGIESQDPQPLSNPTND